MNLAAESLFFGCVPEIHKRTPPGLKWVQFGISDAREYSNPVPLALTAVRRQLLISHGNRRLIMRNFGLERSWREAANVKGAR